MQLELHLHKELYMSKSNHVKTDEPAQCIYTVIALSACIYPNKPYLSEMVIFILTIGVTIVI